MKCPDHEMLSSYVDDETTAAGALSLERHLRQCDVCARSLRLLKALKECLACVPVPDMPQDLVAQLERVTEFPHPVIPAKAGIHIRENFLMMDPRLRGGDELKTLALKISDWANFSRKRIPQACAWGFCAVAAMAVCVFWRQTGGKATPEIPFAWLVAEHRQDIAKLPLAISERALPQPPAELLHDF